MSKHIIIKLIKSELLYDIQNKTYLTGRSRGLVQEPAIAANMQVNNAEPESNQILRTLGDAFQRLLPKLSPYFVPVARQKNEPTEVCPLACKEKGTRQDDYYVADNIQAETITNREFTIPLEVPDNFNDAMIGAATVALHSHLVNYGIAEWYKLTNPQEAGLYYQQSAHDLEEAKGYLHARIRPIKRYVSVL